MDEWMNWTCIWDTKDMGNDTKLMGTTSTIHHHASWEGCLKKYILSYGKMLGKSYGNKFYGMVCNLIIQVTL